MAVYSDYAATMFSCFAFLGALFGKQMHRRGEKLRPSSPFAIISDSHLGTVGCSVLFIRACGQAGRCRAAAASATRFIRLKSTALDFVPIGAI